jgi:hypothetical protein
MSADLPDPMVPFDLELPTDQTGPLATGTGTAVYERCLGQPFRFQAFPGHLRLSDPLIFRRYLSFLLQQKYNDIKWIKINLKKKAN